MLSLVHLLWLALLFVSGNTVVRQFEPYSGPLRYLSFGPFSTSQNTSVRPDFRSTSYTFVQAAINHLRTPQLRTRSHLGV